MKFFFRIFFQIALLFLIISCARRSSPTGGFKDTIPPVLLRAYPKLNSTLFDKDEIELVFDEYVQMKDLKRQLIISPPIEKSYYKIKPPESSISKKIEIELLDSLDKNTTYTFNFGKSIADYNEGNLLPFFYYAFSTGPELDSLEIRGKIGDALQKETEPFILVYLYPADSTFNDSTIFFKKPFYVTSTLDSIIYNFKNIREGEYEIIAIKDEAANYLFDQNIDKIGFTEKPIRLPKDSIIDLTIFKETENFSWGRPFFVNKNRLGIQYYGDLKNMKELKLISEVPEKFISLVNRDRVKDTINYWFKGLDVDSLQFSLQGIDTIRSSTVKFRENKKKDSLIIKSLSGGIIEFKDTFKISSNIPILKINKEFIHIQNIDSTKIPFEVSLDENYDIVNILFEVEPNDEYEISIFPDAINDFFDNSNKSLSYNLQSRDIEYYGNIFIQIIRENDESFILELLDKDFNVVRKEKTSDEADLYVFRHLPPGDYYIRYIKDLNNNGRWDTGNYLKKIQPEKVLYYPNELKLRSNWDLNENFFIEKN